MIRSCALCGSVKEGPDAAIDPMTSDNHTFFWLKMHKPGCPYPKQDSHEQLAWFMENGSPVSSIQD